MEFYYRSVDSDIMVLSADGGLTHRTADQFERELTTLVDSGIAKLVIDCTSLTFISSVGIGVLIKMHKKLARRGGNVKLAAVSSRIIDTLRIARLDKLFEIYPNVESALAEFES